MYWAARTEAGESRLSRYALIFCLVVLVPVGGYLGLNYVLRLRRRAMVRRRRERRRRRGY